MGTPSPPPPPPPHYQLLERGSARLGRVKKLCISMLFLAKKIHSNKIWFSLAPKKRFVPSSSPGNLSGDEFGV